MNLEHLLTEEQLQIRQTIRDFTDKEIIPIAKQLEEDYSLVEQVHQKLVDMGIQSLPYPVEYGGRGHHSMTTMAIIAEELSKGDAKICQLWLGGQQICRYKVAQGYYDLKNWA